MGVNVNYGATPCVQSTPTVAISPSNPSAYAGSTVNYTVSVTNTDSGGCSSSTFNLASTLPSAWATSFSQSAVTLAPAGTTSVTMTKTIPSGTIVATYAIDASATDAAATGTGSANLTVIPPVAPLTITLSIAASSYTTGATVAITATVLSGTTGTYGASITFTLRRPDGSTVIRTASTDTNGKATWNFKPSRKDGKGVFKVTAVATYGTQTASTSSPVPFTVN